MGAGLHGLNELNPKVSIHIIRIYVIPRLTYGLETIRIAAADLTAINMYFKRLLKQIHHLPERNSDAATYLLLGQIPITGEIHQRALTTFGTVECELAHRQLALKSKKSHGWFILVSEILEQYGLPSSHDLLLNPPGKLSWKNTVYRAVNQYWEKQTEGRSIY